MTDRRVTITPLDEGCFKLRGVAYVAEEPNVNGIIYSRLGLLDAFSDFMEKSHRPVTLDCIVNPTVLDTIGTVTEWGVKENAFIVELRTLPLDHVTRCLKAVIESKTDLAIAGACVAELAEDSNRIEIIERITSLGIVRLDQVTSEEK